MAAYGAERPITTRRRVAGRVGGVIRDWPPAERPARDVAGDRGGAHAHARRRDVRVGAGRRIPPRPVVDVPADRFSRLGQGARVLRYDGNGGVDTRRRVERWGGRQSGGRGIGQRRSAGSWRGGRRRGGGGRRGRGRVGRHGWRGRRARVSRRGRGRRGRRSRRGGRGERGRRGAHRRSGRRPDSRGRLAVALHDPSSATSATATTTTPASAATPAPTHTSGRPTDHRAAGTANTPPRRRRWASGRQAASARRSRSSSFASMFEMCDLTVSGLRPRRAAISAFVPPSRSASRTRHSAGVSTSGWRGRPPRLRSMPPS